MNIVVLQGNLTRDPELRNIGSNDRATQVVNFTIAVNRNYKKSDDTWEKETCYVDCEAWDSGARRIAERCKKGDPILVNGSLKFDSWETDGQKRSKLKVRVNAFQNFPRATSGEEAGSRPASEPAAEPVAAGAAGAEGGDPEIPF